MTGSAMVDDDLLLAAARNCAEGYAFPSRRMGRSELVTDLLVGADLGLPAAAPTNSATMLRPALPPELPGVLEALTALFNGPGGGWQLWDPWNCVDLARFGFERSATPCMVRAAGGTAPPRPAALKIVEVGDDRTLRDMNEVVMSGYGLPLSCSGFLWTAEVFGDSRYRAWVGYVDDRPVSTAAAYVGAGLVGVYVVATVPEARGRGYGEALTWVAAMSAPELDATLQASDMGRPIYERMGFQAIQTYTSWAMDPRVGG